jgi:hypothetical protein
MAYLEAAGWLRHAHIWIHPWDLALRDNGLTGSYAAAAFGNRLESELPSTAALESSWATSPSDIVVNQACGWRTYGVVWRNCVPGGLWLTLARCARRCVLWGARCLKTLKLLTG